MLHADQSNSIAAITIHSPGVCAAAERRRDRHEIKSQNPLVPLQRKQKLLQYLPGSIDTLAILWTIRQLQPEFHNSGALFYGAAFGVFNSLIDTCLYHYPLLKLFEVGNGDFIKGLRQALLNGFSRLVLQLIVILSVPNFAKEMWHTQDPEIAENYLLLLGVAGFVSQKLIHQLLWKADFSPRKDNNGYNVLKSLLQIGYEFCLNYAWTSLVISYCSIPIIYSGLVYLGVVLCRDFLQQMAYVVKPLTDGLYNAADKSSAQRELIENQEKWALREGWHRELAKLLSLAREAIKLKMEHHAADLGLQDQINDFNKTQGQENTEYKNARVEFIRKHHSELEQDRIATGVLLNNAKERMYDEMKELNTIHANTYPTYYADVDLSSNHLRQIARHVSLRLVGFGLLWGLRREFEPSRYLVIVGLMYETVRKLPQIGASIKRGFFKDKKPPQESEVPLSDFRRIP